MELILVECDIIVEQYLLLRHQLELVDGLVCDFHRELVVRIALIITRKCPVEWLHFSLGTAGFGPSSVPFLRAADLDVVNVVFHLLERLERSEGQHGAVVVLEDERVFVENHVGKMWKVECVPVAKKMASKVMSRSKTSQLESVTLTNTLHSSQRRLPCIPRLSGKYFLGCEISQSKFSNFEKQCNPCRLCC